MHDVIRYIGSWGRGPAGHRTPRMSFQNIYYKRVSESPIAINLTPTRLGHTDIGDRDVARVLRLLEADHHLPGYHEHGRLHLHVRGASLRSGLRD